MVLEADGEAWPAALKRSLGLLLKEREDLLSIEDLALDAV
jgi:hypothetical protein